MRNIRASAPPKAPRGRPRSEHARQAVLEATGKLIERGGYAAATIEAIAAESGVAKTTIYRWWPNRPTLVVDLLLRMSAQAAPPPTGDDPIRAVRAEMRSVGRASQGLPGKLLISLLGEAECDPDVQTALTSGLFNPRRQATAAVIRQAQERGEMNPDVPALIAVDLLFGPLFYRAFIRHERVTDQFAMQVFEHVMAGLAPKPRGKRAP